MIDANEQKWKEECSKLEIPNQSVYDNFEWFYIKGRKKAHSENEDAFKAFTLDLADRYEKEIELLKAELKAANKIIEVLENPNNWGNHKGIDCYLYNQALAEVEKIRNGGE